MEIDAKALEIRSENVQLSSIQRLGFPLKSDGSTLHLNLKHGDISNRIISVGDTKRAMKISKLFDKPDMCLKVYSNKTFKVYTGTYHNVPISIVATGMGYAMMDLVVREIRQVVEGPLAIIRYGTCGVINHDYRAGHIFIASKGSTFIQSNRDLIVKKDKDKAYRIFKPALPDPILTDLLMENFKEIVGKDKVKGVMNCTADSFYCSQGRPDPNYEDLNEDLIDELKEKYPEAVTLEMETF